MSKLKTHGKGSGKQGAGEGFLELDLVAGP